MISGLNIFGALFIPWALGFMALSFLFDRDELTMAARVALAFVVGTGMLTFIMLFWSLSGGDFSGIGLRLFISGLTVVLALVLLRRKHMGGQGKISPGYGPLDNCPGVNGAGRMFWWELLDIFIVIFLAFHCVYIFWRAFHIPVYGFDPLKINALNAKVFYFQNNIVFPADPVYRGYPLHVSLLHTWLAINIGQWHDQAVKIFAPFYFVSYLVIQYEFMKFLTTARQALWSVGLLLTSNLFVLHASLAYMDFPLMVYSCMTVIMLLLWHVEKEARFLYLAAILAGIGAFIKREGTAYIVVYGILLGLMLMHDKLSTRDRLKAGAKFLLPCLLIALIFPVFKFVHQADSQGVLFDLSWRNLGRVPVIAGQFFWNFFLSGNWNLTWALLVLICLLPATRKPHPIFKWLMTGISLFTGLLFLLFLLTNAFFWIAERDTTLSRLILHFFPLATIAVFLRSASPGGARPENS